MTRFFFDLKFDGESPSTDEEGIVMPGLDEARMEATRSLTDLSKEMVLSGKLTNSLAVIIRDDSGPVLQATLNFEMKRLN
ncbi:DUF6894 family protein [Bradyrhizobium sp. JYMT SZCCT0428]|uniref:DUF6894 family protein n=1 Tax=Bradyrhizobium sp. JYMT SZCCT0428 TaxID=2807673 RepID=UPI001BA9EB9B|nr:hypothetical protein [Bradyrhizobium sp. JYMT SZCCT0428]MBR1157100.1 hypothetical protein [Bradyrhizobium sp. JYMT SZCCT0428]